MKISKDIKKQSKQETMGLNKSLMIIALLSLLTVSCTTQSVISKPLSNKTTPMPEPTISQPSDSYLKNAQANISKWQKLLTDTQTTTERSENTSESEVK